MTIFSRRSVADLERALLALEQAANLGELTYDEYLQGYMNAIMKFYLSEFADRLLHEVFGEHV